MNRTPPAGLSIEASLGREILASERLRVTVFAGVMLALLAMFAGNALVFPEGAATLPPTARAWMMALWSFGALYGFVVRHTTGRFLRSARQPPMIRRYLGAFIETSMPTVAVMILAGYVTPVYALHLPATSFYFVFIILATLRLDLWLCTFTGAIAAVEYLALAMLYVGQAPTGSIAPELAGFGAHVVRATLYLGTGAVAGLVGVLIKRQFLRAFRSVEDRNRVVSVFGQHVSPQVVEELLTHDVPLGGEERRVCVMFLDIRGFTAFAGTRTPTEVVDYLNTLFGFMVDSINRHGGIVNKFLGDGFMAVFGAPISTGKDCRNAVAAAREITGHLDRFNAATSGSSTRIGIGLHVGEAVTGNIGSELRREYTIIGSVVNLASRIEQLNKQLGTTVLITEDVVKEAGEVAADAVPVGPIEIRGYDDPLPLYRLV